MVQYLTSSYLTATERAAILLDQEPFQGLDNLYSKIMEGLLLRVPNNQHGKIRKVFEWLTVAQEPWSLGMLETALAVQPDRTSTPADIMDHIRDSLLHLCGSLVEIREDDVVRFIHLSAAEYLVKSSTMSSLSVNVNTAHCSIANLCLSYLRHDIPHSPLSENSTISPRRPDILKKFRLLPYVVNFWAFHAEQSLKHSIGETPGPIFSSSETFDELFDLLSLVTKDQALVTVWIEASFLFEINPSLMNIPKYIESLSAHVDIGSNPRELVHRLRKLEHLSSTLQRFSNNLIHLNKRWGETLSREPNEIWLPSVNAFTDSEFWIGTTQAKVKWLSDAQETDTILVLSQISSDGKDVGVIKMSPIAKFVSYPNSNHLSKCSPATS
jgi:hypothetical protein